MQWPGDSLTVVTCFMLCCCRQWTDTYSLNNTITSRESVQATKELGLQFTTVNETLVDMAVTLMQLGLAIPRPKPTK